MYHGTDIVSAKAILSKRMMKPSMGDHHWLGNGYYFYENEEYAFRWILIKYTKNFSNAYSDNYDNIFKEYMILSADINTNKIFNLGDINNKLLFIRVKNEVKKKAQDSKRYKKQISKNGIADGVIFNILFEEMGYDKEYDAVKAVFPIVYTPNTGSRQDFLPEPQICVKNIAVIQNIQKANDDVVEDKYKNFIEAYNAVKIALKEDGLRNIEEYGKLKKGNNQYRKGGRHDGLHERIRKNI